MADDGFSVENLRVKDLPPLEPGVARRRRPQREFVMMSREQSDRLDKVVNFGTERVFRHLLFLTWRLPDKPVVLANAELARKGINRHIKRRALLELEARGLIRVEWRYKKSPIVTVLGG
jgi:hypothetical protein